MYREQHQERNDRRPWQEHHRERNDRPSWRHSQDSVMPSSFSLSKDWMSSGQKNRIPYIEVSVRSHTRPSSQTLQSRMQSASWIATHETQHHSSNRRWHKGSTYPVAASHCSSQQQTLHPNMRLCRSGTPGTCLPHMGCSRGSADGAASALSVVWRCCRNSRSAGVRYLAPAGFGARDHCRQAGRMSQLSMLNMFGATQHKLAHCLQGAWTKALFTAGRNRSTLRNETYRQKVSCRTSRRRAGFPCFVNHEAASVARSMPAI